MTDQKPNHPQCPLCHNEVPTPVSESEVDIRGVAAYWIASLHESTRRLEEQEKENGETAVQEQIRRNVDTIRTLLALFGVT